MNAANADICYANVAIVVAVGSVFKLDCWRQCLNIVLHPTSRLATADGPHDCPAGIQDS